MNSQTRQQVLVTGDYWHQDFQHILSGFDAVTLVQIDKIDRLTDQTFDLVVIAQSRRDQYELEVIENLQSRFEQSPVVAVLGSWCEGETRSGQPWPGVLRIYWHQWSGRFQGFQQQMEVHGISSWHAPRTSSNADRILATHTLDSTAEVKCVGISAWTRPQFEMVQDAVESFGWECRWVERCVWDAQSVQLLNPICIEADSLTPDLEKRITWLKSEFPLAGFVIILNFPRINDVTELAKLGIANVVSKPFELNDLQAGIVNAFQAKIEATAGGQNEVRENEIAKN
jgi:hypothetical protein